MLSTNFKIGTDAGITWHSLRNAVKMHNTFNTLWFELQTAVNR